MLRGPFFAAAAASMLLAGSARAQTAVGPAATGSSPSQLGGPARTDQLDQFGDRVANALQSIGKSEKVIEAARAESAAAKQVSACIKDLMPKAPTMTQEQKVAAIAGCRAAAGLR